MDDLLAPVLLVVCSGLIRITAADDNMTEMVLLTRLLDPARYDATIRPDAERGVATLVEIDLTLNSVGPVNDIEMEISTSFFLRQQWRDERLQFNEFNRSIVISYKRLSALWVPDIYFTQSKEETLHVVTTPNVMIRLSPDGSVLYTQRLSVILKCPMGLEKFPMDQQTCHIAMESYSFDADSLYFKWSEERQATDILPEANIPDFTITDILAEDCTSKYAIGTYSCLRAVLHLKRETGFYATQTYVPSVLIVILSWASFWIDHEAVPARISVGLLTVLTITTQSSGAREQLPRVPYIKSIDVWMIFCLVFVFAAYMEFAIVIVLSRVSKKRKYKGEVKPQVSTVQESIQRNEQENVPTKPTESVTSEDAHAGRMLDKCSRLGFPCAFVIFNLVYWTYYNI